MERKRSMPFASKQDWISLSFSKQLVNPVEAALLSFKVKMRVRENWKVQEFLNEPNKSYCHEFMGSLCHK